MLGISITPINRIRGVVITPASLNSTKLEKFGIEKLR